MKRTPKAEKVCHCGYRRGDPAIHEEPEYTTWGWIMLSMFGMTPRPDYIAFRCILCRAEVGRSRDPKLLHRKTLRAKVGTTGANDTHQNAA